MQFALEVRPPGADLFYAGLPEAGLVTIGNKAPASLVLPDPLMSSLHFQLSLEAGRTFCIDSGSGTGTFINGLRLDSAELKHGDAVRAGQSVLRLTAITEGKTALKTLPPGPVKLTPFQAEVITAIEEGCHFAVLDGAVDPAIRELLNASGTVYQSLYEGVQALEIAPVGPFLVDLHKALPLVQQLILRGWGKSWGVFLRTEVDFDGLRKHLRHLLTVETEDRRRLLFRFYDPRVLRTVMPTWTAAQKVEFFGPVTHLVFESPDTETLSFFAR